MQPQIAVVAAFAFVAGVVRSSVGFVVGSIEPAVAFVVGEHLEVTSRLLAAVALPFAAAAWPTAVAAAFAELVVVSSVGAFEPFVVDVVETEPLVVTSFAVVAAEAALEEEADSSQAVADLAEEAEVAASPALVAVAVAVVEEEVAGA